MAKEVKVLTAKKVGEELHLSWYCGKNSALWYNIKDKVKMIPGRDWNPNLGKKGMWTCPDNFRTRSLLGQLGFRFKDQEKPKPKRKKKIPNIPQEYKKEVLANVDARLRDYQIDGVKFLQHHNFRAINADFMGTGKTCQVVSALRTSGIRPALFIVPATLKINIKRECEMWLDPQIEDSIHIVEGTKNFNYANKSIIIVNYDILYQHTEYIIKEVKPSIVLIDEAHLLKSDYTYIGKYYPERPMKKNEIVKRNDAGIKGIYKAAPKRVEASRIIIHGLSEEKQKETEITWNGVKHVIPMTATPILNNPGDIFNLLQFVHPERFNSREKFEDFFCTSEEGFKPGTKKITGGKNLDLLHCELVEKYMIRRKITDVLKELPPTIQTVIPIEMEGKELKDYRDAEEDIVSWLVENEPRKAHLITEENSALKKFTTLMGLAYEAKKNHATKFIKGLLNVPKEKIIIFVYHKKVVNDLYEAFGNIAVKLNGECTPKEKQEAVDSFQNDPTKRVFIGNINSAGVGLTLTAGSRVVFIETGFNVSLVQQCIARAARMGQTAENVLVYFLVADESVESMVMKKLDTKKQIIDQIMEGEDLQEEKMLSFLWEQYSNKNKKPLDKQS